MLKLKRLDYALQGKRERLLLLEKGNKEKLVWLHREAEQFLDAYLEVSGTLSGPPGCSSRTPVSNADPHLGMSIDVEHHRQDSIRVCGNFEVGDFPLPGLIELAEEFPMFGELLDG